jgi:hypothetical protein
MEGKWAEHFTPDVKNIYKQLRIIMVIQDI